MGCQHTKYFFGYHKCSPHKKFMIKISIEHQTKSSLFKPSVMQPISLTTFDLNSKFLVCYSSHDLIKEQFKEQTILNHLNTELVCYSDLHCMSLRRLNVPFHSVSFSCFEVFAVSPQLFRPLPNRRESGSGNPGVILELSSSENWKSNLPIDCYRECNFEVLFVIKYFVKFPCE